MQVERIIADVETLGPGKRICIWVNGCKRNCKGCVSRDLQAFKKENECDIVSILAKFELNKFTGITISGGEPFEQTKDLANLVQFLRSKGVEDILIYTGYTQKELLERRECLDETKYVLQNIGVLIDGPYIEEQDDNKDNLKGSKNQNIIFVREELIPKYQEFASTTRKMQEFFIFPHFVGVGIPTKEYIENF